MSLKAAVIGAFDRYNYGDVLFPHIVEYYVKSKNLNINLEYFGLRNTDMTAHGGKNTQSISSILQSPMAENFDVIIVAGGHVIGASWAGMFLHFCGNRFSYLFFLCFFKILKKKRDEIARTFLKGKTRFPWVVTAEDVGSKVKVFYNAVGGSKVKKQEELEYIQNALSKADYVSFRDKDSLNYYGNGDSKLSPDSAAIISDVYELTYLKNNVSQETQRIVSEYEPFITVQLNIGLTNSGGKALLESLNEQLKKITEKGYKIVFLPLGYAAGHYDQYALRKAFVLDNEKYYLFKKPHILDTTYVIARSEAFVGTSLHGNIIASAYEKPHIALRYKNFWIPKLESYLRTWEIEEQNKSVEIDNLAETLFQRMEISHGRIVNNAQRMKRLVYENFDRMFVQLT